MHHDLIDCLHHDLNNVSINEGEVTYFKVSSIAFGAIRNVQRIGLVHSILKLQTMQQVHKV